MADTSPKVSHICMDLSEGYAMGPALAQANAAISHERSHVVALVIEAIDTV